VWKQVRQGKTRGVKGRQSALRPLLVGTCHLYYTVIQVVLSYMVIAMLRRFPAQAWHKPNLFYY
jgi:hypothetical protein